MAQTSLGIDIGDDLLSAAVVSGTGREAQVTACASLPLSVSDPDALTEGLRLLLEQLGEQCKAAHCVVGLSLTWLSLRNLHLPFTDEKKIGQILPFELEEQLLLPADEQIIATVSTAGREAGTSLLTAAAEKTLLRQHLDVFQGLNLEPDSICPAVYVLADRLCRTDHAGNTFLLLHSDFSCVQMVLARHGEIVFMRRLAWPDVVFTHALFEQEQGGITIADSVAAADAFRSISAAARRSLDYFALQSGLQNIQPDYFVLSGPMQHCLGFRENIEADLGLSGRLCDLSRDGAAALSTEIAGQWQAAVYDKALALALFTGRRGKEAGLDFRQGEFAPPRHLFGSKKQITALAMAAALLLFAGCGWLFADYRQLQKKYNQLAGKTEKIFQESFPGVNPGPDPYLHMRSRRKSMETSPVAMPIFTEEKRVLAILADISARIPASIQLQVDRLVIDQTTAGIKGSTDAFNNVNTMQSLLNKSGRYAEVKIVSATKGKKDEGILFEIRLQLKTGAES
ncbi:PilN domain-containing protein [Desulfobulbus sp. F5]|nr:PilN domain-containing protein [Desulfobulbus sp. F5]